MREGEQAGMKVRYGLLLITLIAAYLVSAVTRTRWGGALHVALVGMVALLAIRQARLRPRVRVFAAAVTVATTVAAGFCTASSNSTVEGIGSIWVAVVLLLTVVTLVERVLRMDQVDTQSIYAALSAYLLIGLMFAAVYGALDFLVTEPFFANGQPANPTTLQYFSFTTLTTLGYGDFTAAGNLGRALAVLEALAGQIFLATLVARLVSAYGTGRRRPPPDG
jgi:hypothetical protein